MSDKTRDLKKRIAELEDKIETKDERIKYLEELIDDKDSEIYSLEEKEEELDYAKDMIDRTFNDRCAVCLVHNKCRLNECELFQVRRELGV